LRAGAVLARIMTVFAKEEQLIIMIIYVVGEVGALILRIADMFVHLVLQKWGPFAFNAF